MSRIEKGQLSRRERQITDILFRVGQATAKEVQDELPDPPSYSATRALLATMERKGLVKHTKEGRKYVYMPAMTEKRARRTALKHLVRTFFQGKPENLVAAMLDPEDQKLSRKEIAGIRKLVE